MVSSKFSFPSHSVLSIVIIACIVTGTGCGKSESDREESDFTKQEIAARKAHELKVEIGIEEMAQRWNAVRFDINQLIENHNPAYTLHLQNLLMRTDGRPILFLSEVLDMGKAGSHYQVEFGRKLYIPWKPNIYFVLKCPREKVEKVTGFNGQNKKRLSPKHAVVANFSSIKKVPFWEGSLLSRSSSDSIQSSSSNLFIAKGECLEFLPQPIPPDSMPASIRKNMEPS